MKLDTTFITHDAKTKSPIFIKLCRTSEDQDLPMPCKFNRKKNCILGKTFERSKVIKIQGLLLLTSQPTLRPIVALALNRPELYHQKKANVTWNGDELGQCLVFNF